MLAHRGLALEAPENTLLAFLKALAIGITHLETDVHASSDGIAMISHDPDLSRLSGRAQKVGQLTAEQLRGIDLGEGQGYCSLEEALDAFPDAKFNIDIKAGAAVQPTVDAILAAKAVDRVLIGSFSPARRLAAISRMPGVATSVSSRGAVAAVAAAKAGALPLLRRVLRDVDAVQLPVSVLRLDAMTPRAIRNFHAAGVEVHVWTINEPAEMQRLLDAGVDGLVTDRADLALEVLAARLQR